MNENVRKHAIESALSIKDAIERNIKNMRYYQDEIDRNTQYMEGNKKYCRKMKRC